MNKLTILHLSDFHYCLENKNDIDIVFNAFLKDLRRFKEKNIKPDMVIFSGDLINSGDQGYSESRNDYSVAKLHYIDPILQLLELNINQFYICPGNHDVQRSRVDVYYESGLKSKLVDRSSVNALLDQSDQYSMSFSRLENYEKFFGSFTNENLVHHHKLYSTYIFRREDIKIGIACINSAWRAFGGKEDYGQLIIGERVLDSCMNDLRDCDLRIGVAHHPFDFLVEFERTDLKRLVYSFFNFWLTGHMHELDSSLVQTFNDGMIAVISAGALYHSRDYYNGYSLVEYDPDSKAGEVHLREYQNRSRSFQAATAYQANDGIFKFTLSSLNQISSDIDFSLTSKLRDTVSKQIRESLLPVVMGSSYAPKTLEELFVEPILRSESKQKSRSLLEYEKKTISTVTVAGICESDKNYLLVGGKESGKTTLLQYLYLNFLTPVKATTLRFPFLVTFKNLSKGKNRLKRAIQEQLAELNISLDLEEILLSKPWVLLIDDFDVNDANHISSLMQFAKEYSLGQYILAVNENVFKDIGEGIDLGISYETYFIYSFGRKQVRELVGKWFSDSNATQIGTSKTADLVIKRIEEINMPRTPFIVSMILSAIEHINVKDVTPVNKSMLMNIILDLLLQKISPFAALPAGIDYKNIEDFLAYLSYTMCVKNKENVIRFDDAMNFTFEYFSKRGLRTPLTANSFIEYLCTRGVLFSGDNIVKFRYQGFFEYFVAKYFRLDNEFYKTVINGDIHEFDAPIDYLTGQERNNIDLLEIMRQRLLTSINDFILFSGLNKVELTFFDSFDSSEDDNLFVDSNEHFPNDENEDEDKSEFVNGLRTLRLDEDTQDVIGDTIDDIRDAIEPPPNSTQDKGELHVNNSGQSLANDSPETTAFADVFLYANIIKNCESLELINKKESLRNCLTLALTFLYAEIMFRSKEIDRKSDDELKKEYVKIFEEMKAGEVGGEISPAVMRKSIKTISKSVMFMLIQQMLSDELGTRKLDIALLEEIRDAANPFVVRLICGLIYLDLGLDGGIEIIEKLAKESFDNNYYRGLIYRKLFMHYSSPGLKQDDLARLERILADLYVKESKLPNNAKSTFINGLRKNYYRRSNNDQDF